MKQLDHSKMAKIDFCLFNISKFTILLIVKGYSSLNDALWLLGWNWSLKIIVQLEVKLLYPCVCATSVLGILKVLDAFASGVHHGSSYYLALWSLSGKMRRSNSLSRSLCWVIGRFQLILLSSTSSVASLLPFKLVLPVIVLAMRSAGVPGLPSSHGCWASHGSGGRQGSWTAQAGWYDSMGQWLPQVSSIWLSDLYSNFTGLYRVSNGFNLWDI